MKNLILLILMVFVSTVSFAQKETLPNSYLPGYYSDTVSVSTSKGDLFNRAKEYLAKNTDIKKDEIQMDDPSSGRLIANTTSVTRDVFSDMLGKPYIVKFATSIAVKDGKYKYIINNILYDEKNVTPVRATDIIKEIIKSLKLAMATKSNLDF